MFDSISLNKTRWVLPDVDLDQVERIARRYDLPEVVARLLCQRGVAADDIPGFLNPTLRDHFPDPLALKDMGALAAFIAEAVGDKRRISIFGDFDVDGATSSALLHRFFKHCGINAPIYIPGRLTEGYGPNVQALQSLKDQGAEILFLLDCGTTAFDVVAAGAAMGLEIIILDHHEAEMNLTEARFTVNPKRKDDASGLDMLAAVGVTFMACVAFNAALREAGFFTANGIEEPPLKDWLDLVALGTVCDMVPLTGVNRLMVRQGFAQMRASSNAGLRALLDVSGVKDAPGPYHAGFMLGPRINAGSRVDQSDLGARLLSTDDPEEALNIAWILQDCNEKRKALQIDMEAAAMAQAESAGMDKEPLIFVGDAAWHSGLSGLVAGRLKDKYGRPACVYTLAENELGVTEARGSGRSVPGIHIAQAFIEARQAGIIEKGGGHAMAGGFTVAPEKIEALHTFLREHIARQAEAVEANIETVIDGVLSVRGARVDFVRMIQEQVGPFGQAQPEPLFLFQNIRVHNADIVGSSHVRALISDWEGGSRMKAMAFRAVGTPLGEALLKQGKSSFDLVGTIKIDNWGGQDKVELHIKDAALAEDVTQRMTAKCTA